MWSMLFGLLMWDCLFADVPDTLRSQFQLAPLDLSTPHFYEVICARLLHSVCPPHRGNASHALGLLLCCEAPAGAYAQGMPLVTFKAN